MLIVEIGRKTYKITLEPLCRDVVHVEQKLNFKLFCRWG